MEHKVHVDDERKIMILRIMGEFSIDDAKLCLDSLSTQMENRKTREPYPMLVDLSNAPAKLDKEVREFLRDKNEGRRISKQAFIVTNPAVRMIAKIMTSTQKTSDEVKFFKSEEDALKWLSEG